MKKFLSVFLCLAMILSMSVSAFAAGSEKTYQEAMKEILLATGMEERQLGKFPYDYEWFARSINMFDGVDYEAEATVTAADYAKMQANVKPVADALSADKMQPLFIDGKAVPIFPYTTGAVETGYSNADSDIIRYCVYVETNYDTDLDGKLDLVKALVQIPRAAFEGDYKAATIYEARPYITGCTNLSARDEAANPVFDIAAMYNQPAARVPAATTTTAVAAAEADSADWYYYNPDERMMDYEDLTWYDYYLVRGYAVVECGGLGTKGSEGFETCGTDLEIDAFKCVIEWLHGDRVAYTDKTSNVAIEADWSNGKVGMTGRSYAGTTQFGLATTGVAGLETIVPVAGIASWYEYTFCQGVSNSGTIAYSDYLARYCAGRKLDADDWATIKDSYMNYLGKIRDIQNELYGDYDATGYDHWTIRDYTLNAENIKCPALIVHGLNDENVRTKQFDLMYKAYQEADVNVKLFLHQNGHLTPTYPAGGTEIFINDAKTEMYDDMLNKWFSHYLYGVDNGAENMAAVTVQDNVDGSWDTYDSWDAASTVILASDKDDLATISSVATRSWYSDPSKFFDGNSANTVAYAMDVTEDMTIEGSVAVNFRAATETTGQTDNLKISAYLYDVADEAFPVYNRSGSYLPNTMLSSKTEGGAWMGGGLDNFDLVEYKQSMATYKQVEYGWMDLCNPKAGYDSASATRDNRVDVDGETYYDYTMYLQPDLYTVKAGHKLVLVLTTSTSSVSAANTYKVTFDQSKTYAELPVANNVANVEVEAVAAENINEIAYELNVTAKQDLGAAVLKLDYAENMDLVDVDGVNWTAGDVNLVINENIAAGETKTITLLFHVATGTQMKDTVVSAKIVDVSSASEAELFCEASSSAKGFVMGDANENGVVAVNDLVRLRNYIVRNGEGVVVGKGADMNADGVVNGLDMTILYNYFAKTEL